MVICVSLSSLFLVMVLIALFVMQVVRHFPEFNYAALSIHHFYPLSISY